MIRSAGPRVTHGSPTGRLCVTQASRMGVQRWATGRP